MALFPFVNMCFGRRRQTIRYTTHEGQDIIKDQDTKITYKKDLHNLHNKIKSKTRFALKVMKCTIKRFVKRQ